jgi:hypothetical protein
MRQQPTIWFLMSVFLAPSGATAYTLRTTDAGRPVHWANTAVSFRVDRSLGDVAAPDDAARTVVEALAEWGGLPGSSFFFDGDPRPVGAGAQRSSDGATDIVLVEEDWPHDPAFAGVTLVTYDVATGEIWDADVFLNGADHDFEVEASGGAYDIGNVLTHELGHLLGMGHSEDADATMFAVSRPGETDKRTLSDDDAAGFEELYGGAAGDPGGSGAPAAMPTCAVTPRAPGGSAVLLGVVMFMLGFVSRVRRRRALRDRSLSVAVVAGLIALVGGAGAGWTSVGRYLPVQELARRADVVFRGTVQERNAHWAGRVIVTDVTLSVDECWAGRCRGRSRVVRELGGEVDGTGMLAPEPTALPVGAQAVLFAREARAGAQGVLVLVGGAQAVFTLEPGTDRAARDVTALLDRPLPAPVERLDLRFLRAVVRSRPAGQ